MKNFVLSDDKQKKLRNFIQKIELQNNIIEKQKEELEKLIAYIDEETKMLEKSIKEIIGKEKGTNWINTLCKK